MKFDEKIFEIALPIVENEGFDLVDVEYIRERNEKYLRVFIEKPGGITIDDCQNISEKLDKVIEELELINEKYIFEVSSPGLERVLKKDREFDYYQGELVEIKFYKPIDGHKTIQGDLDGYDTDSIYIRADGSRKGFNRKSIAVVKRVYTF